MNGTPCSEIRKKESVSWKASETEIEWVESKVKKNDNDNLELNPHSQHNVYLNNSLDFCDGEKERGTYVAILLVENIIWKGNTGSPEKLPWSEAFYTLVFYFDNYYDKNIMMDSKDEIWTSGLKQIPNNQFFDPLEIYDDLLQTYSSYLHDSFLILEAANGKLRPCPVKTVNEMYQEYFQINDK